MHFEVICILEIQGQQLDIPILNRKREIKAMSLCKFGFMLEFSVSPLLEMLLYKHFFPTSETCATW